MVHIFVSTSVISFSLILLDCYFNQKWKVGEDDLVEARVALRFVAEVDELGYGVEVLVVRAAFQMQMA